MLEQMRKHMNWIMWTILAIIIVTFLFFGIYPTSSPGDAAAQVNDDIITRSEFNRVYRNMYETYRQIFKDQFTDAMAKNIRAQALRDLIQNKLLVQEAGRIGIRVSDEEVQAAIMKIPAFSPQGRFDKVAYERYLAYINQKPSAFEESQREYLLRQKLERMIEEGVDVTDDEAAAAYRARNPKAAPGDFEKNKAMFRQSVLAEKRRSAVEAYVKGLEKKAKIRTSEGVLEM
jgi:parvulin-like peptidyl-prolyl isomerase